MQIDTCVETSDIIVTEAAKKFLGSQSVENAKIFAIDVNEVPVEAENSVGRVER